MKQYSSIKEQYPDAILFFRLGDFYEMFGDDAVIASKILQIALTTRDKSKDKPTPMCGIPYFASEAYIAKLIRAGHKIALCEQIEDPKDAKGIVAREVVRLITPGTHTPDHPKENTFIISIYPSGSKHGIAGVDISTGEFFVFETEENIEDELHRFEPKEVLIPSSLTDNIHYREILTGFFISEADDGMFDYTEAYRKLLKHFRVASLSGFGCEGMSSAISAAGGLLSYIENTHKIFPGFKKISALRHLSFMFMDASTQKNLELTHNLKDGSRADTLLWVLDETLTAMGGRFLRGAILRPLTERSEIRARLGAVEYLIDDFELLEQLRTSLRKVQDLERLASRISSGTANARDLVAIMNSLNQIPGIRDALSSIPDTMLASLAGSLSELPLIIELIGRAITDSPPLSLREGGIIRDRFNSEVDEIRSLNTSSRDFIAAMEAREKKRTGISSLKTGYNKVFGFYIEVTKSNLDLVPDDYIRKQTLVGCERFITPELKEYEDKVLGSEEKLRNMEYEIFQEILGIIRKETDDLFATSYAVAVVDFLCALAVVAKRHDYCKPAIAEESLIEIADGRHPVLERNSSGEKFIPNSASLDVSDKMLVVLTGPNMAGKSTYMRQTAIIVLMAQMGGYVPASSATLGITDRIFTRIGASDFLTQGQSTFMVEMIETANIVNNATSRSLIILDEVGRGTSTFDGISIAWAVAEFLITKVRARTLFATHYNELTELALIYDGVKNCNISVKEWGDEIIFLRKIEDGPADKSYGIQVARLAGLPESIIDRAKEVLANLENEELNEIGTPKLAKKKTKKKQEQLSLFSTVQDAVMTEIAGLDPGTLQPEEALALLAKMKKKLSF